MRKLLGVTLVLFLLFFSACNNNTKSDSIKTFHTDSWMESVDLTDFQADFLSSVFIDSIKKDDYGYLVSYREGPSIFDYRLALLTENNIAWSIGPYSHLQAIEKDSDTLHVNFVNGPYEQGRFDVSKETGEITYENYDRLRGHYKTSNGYIALTFDALNYDGTYQFKKISKNHDSILLTIQVETIDEFIAIDEETFLIIARIEGSQTYQQHRLIIINEDGVVSIDQTIDDRVKSINVLSSYLYIHYQNDHIKIYDFQFNNLASFEPMYSPQKTYQYILEMNDGVIVYNQGLTKSNYIKIGFDGTIEEDFDYIELLVDIEFTYQKHLVFFPNEDRISIEKYQNIYYLVKKDKTGEIIFEHELGTSLFDFDVSDEKITLSVFDESYKYLVFDYEGNLVEETLTTCGIHLIDLNLDMYLCRTNTELRAYHLDHELIYSIGSFPGYIDIYPTTFDAHLITYPEGYDPENTLPIVTTSIFVLVSDEGEIIKTYEDYAALYTFIYDDRTFIVVRSKDSSALDMYVYEINAVGEMIEYGFLLDVYNKNNTLVYVILDQKTLRYMYIPIKRFNDK